MEKQIIYLFNTVKTITNALTENSYDFGRNLSLGLDAVGLTQQVLSLYHLYVDNNNKLCRQSIVSGDMDEILG